MKSFIALSVIFLLTSLFVFGQSDSTVLHPFRGLHVPAGLYAAAVALGILGQVVAMLTMYSTLKQKAKLANLIFDFKSFWSDEWPNQIKNLCIVIIFVMFIPVLVLKKPEDIWLIRPVMPIVGFSGMTIFLQYASIANKALNAAVGAKAQQADEANNTTDAPTPAVKVKS